MDRKVEEKDIGSASSLRGDIYVLNFFVSTSDNRWEKSEVDNVILQLRSALDWIEKEARRWNSMQQNPVRERLNFVNEGYWYDDVVIPRIPVLEDDPHSFRKVADAIVKAKGFADLYSISDWVKRKGKPEQFILLFFFKSDGRSFANPTTTVLNNYDKYIYNTEFAFLYCDPSREMIRPGTIAHEILHLFGAWDLYEGAPYITAEQSRAAKSNYPNSIMISSYYMESKSIDEVTAWLVGINREYKSYFEFYKPTYKYY